MEEGSIILTPCWRHNEEINLALHEVDVLLSKGSLLELDSLDEDKRNKIEYCVDATQNCWYCLKDYLQQTDTWRFIR